MSELAQDPVCHMKVDPARARAQAEHEGKTYYFCCAGCAQKFEAEPERYLAPKATTGAGLVRLGPAMGKAPAGMSAPTSGPTVQNATAPAKRGSGPAVSGAIYTCPMDPEVRQPGPGACPKCGMDLEPEIVAPAPVKVEYTCPMHPEIVRDQPGTCPICGMDLEPRTVTAAPEENVELRRMERRDRK